MADRKWMYLADRSCKEFVEGVKSFLDFTQKSQLYSDPRCPCRVCENSRVYDKVTVEEHLYRHGFAKNYRRWLFHGEAIEDVKRRSRPPKRKFEYDDHYDYVPQRVVSAESVLANSNSASLGESSRAAEPGAVDFASLGREKLTSLDFTAKLMNQKVLNGWSRESFDANLRILRESFPDSAKIPGSFLEAEELLREFGFGFETIHACKYDCALFWKENSLCDRCPVCYEPRYKFEDENGEKVPQKTMYYFPLKPRLQRLFSSKETAAEMRWHIKNRTDDENILRHPADSVEWSILEEEYCWFAAEPRNVRLGLATKGFDPFYPLSDPSNSHNMWPVTLVPYNLPPSKCISGEFFMLTLLIPGPESPGLEIDIYLRPLIDELKDLWKHGVETHDASTGENFRLHASLLWTISDFPTYETLTGWGMTDISPCLSCSNSSSLSLRGGKKFGLGTSYGYLGYRQYLPPDHPWRDHEPYCEDWGSERDEPPKKMSGDSILRQLESLRRRRPGKNPANGDRKRRFRDFSGSWVKKSIFFELDYWSKLIVRYNIDVMSVEKRLCDNIIGTFLDIGGKTKDSARDRLDLAALEIRKELHFRPIGGGQLLKPPAVYTLPKESRRDFCKFFENVRLPDSYGIDFSKNVNVARETISGLEPHECHVAIQRVLPVAAYTRVRSDLTVVLTELGTFFQRLCGQTLMFDDLVKLEERIGLIYYKLAKIYPPSFFDILVHSALHLPREAVFAGPVAFRSIHPFERNMEKYRKYVSDKDQPELSIAEAYSANEAMRFCSLFTEKKSNEENELNQPSLSVFSEKVQLFGAQDSVIFSTQDLAEIGSYVLRHCKEIESYIKEYEEEKIEEDDDRFEIGYWFLQRIKELKKTNPELISQELESLANGPKFEVRRYSSCVVDGVRFLTEEEDKHRTTQNSGVFGVEDHGDKKFEFYGVVTSILELIYGSDPDHRIVLFKCKWFETGKNYSDSPACNLTSIQFQSKNYGDRPYLLAAEAQMAFFLPTSDWKGYVQKVDRRKLFYDVIEPGFGSEEEIVEFAKPESCNFKWTEEVGTIEEGDLIRTNGAEIVLADSLPDLCLESVGEQLFEDLFIPETSYSDLPQISDEEGDSGSACNF